MKSQNGINLSTILNLCFVIFSFSQATQAGTVGMVKYGLKSFANALKSPGIRPSNNTHTAIKQTELMSDIKDYNNFRSKVLSHARAGEVRSTKEGGTLSDLNGQLSLHYPPHHAQQNVSFMVPNNIDELAEIAKLTPEQVKTLQTASETTIKNSSRDGKQQVFQSFGDPSSKISRRLTWDTNGEVVSSVLQMPSQFLSLSRASSHGRIFEVSFVKEINGYPDLIIDHTFHLPEGEILKQAKLKTKNILEIETKDNFNQTRIYEMNLSAKSTNSLRQKSFTRAESTSTTLEYHTKEFTAYPSQKNTIIPASEVR